MSKQILHIGIDDTDSPKGMCTTFLAYKIINRLKKERVDFLDFPNLVRFNPNIPWKTRGNGAVGIKISTSNPEKIKDQVQTLFGDPFVKKRSGIFEFILGDNKETKLLDIRVFDESTKRKVYNKQVEFAELNNVSNCSYCALGQGANKSKIWKLSEMDADHVTAWSKGGKTDIENCEMLCKSHNRAKGNR